MLDKKTGLLKELQDFYNNYCNEIREEAGRLQDKSMPPLPEEKFALFETTGNRLIYEEDYFLRRRFLAVFGLKAILDGEKKDIEKLEEVILSICEEECWALPAHVKRDVDKNWRIYVDLFAAETAQTLSEIRFLLKDKLSETVRDRAKEEVLTRVLNPFMSLPFLMVIGSMRTTIGAPCAAEAWEARRFTFFRMSRKNWKSCL